MITPARRIQAMCRWCARMVPGHHGAEYIDAVTRLLFMTIAHESGGFRWRRQLGFRPDTTRGAFGLAQVEMASMSDSFRLLHANDVVGKASRDYLHCMETEIPANSYRCRMLLQAPKGDGLSVLFCRLHYWRIPEAVPLWDVGRAQYAKRYYNTPLGKATWMDYLSAYHRHWPVDA